MSDKVSLMTNKKKERSANLELLRCIAMLMVVVLHYLGKGELLPELTGERLGAAGTVAWLLEAFAIGAVNLYMLISGYFLSTAAFKPGRIINLWVKVWIYSVGVGAAALVLGIFPAAELTVHDILTLLLPISMNHYWFVTAYFFMFVFLPFLGSGLQRLSGKQFRIALGVLLFLFCILKSVLPVRLETDMQGYDCIWYLCVFLTAAYVRRFGLGVFEKARYCIALFVVASLAIFGLTMGLRVFWQTTGSLERMLKMGLEYNHILPFLAAFGLFGAFLHVKVGDRTGTWVTRLGAHTLGVYLLHENLTLRYAWQKWLGAERADSVVGVILYTCLAAVAVFLIGVLLDWLLDTVRNGIHRLLLSVKPYRWIAQSVDKMDLSFAEEKKN